MPELIDYALNDTQKKVVLLSEKMSYQQIGDHLGVTKGVVSNTMRGVKARASRQGFSPEHDMTRAAPETHLVKGTSTYYDEDGKIRGQWVKTTLAHKRIEEFAEAVINSAIETIKPIKPKAAAKLKRDPDRLAVYPLPDYHIGMQSGEDGEKPWNSEIAEARLTSKYEEVLAGTPNTECALVTNLGDFFHSDNHEGVTGGHGHSLDTSERWSETLKIGFRMFRKIVDSALLKHKQVHVICASGNHDVHTSAMLAVATDALYSNEPRCTVDTTMAPFHFFEFGKCLFGVTHGHRTKPERLYQVMCEDQKEAWGRCLHHHWLTGHFHTQRMVDIGTQKIETFRTAIPGDAYSHGNGYRASRGLQSLTFHKERGEVNRSIAMM